MQNKLKRSRKGQSLLLCFTLSLLLFTSVGGGRARAFAGGSGTAADPFVITSVDHLKMIPERAEGYYLLDGDLTVSGQFAPIKYFRGTFDGDFHTINGLQNNLFFGLVGTARNLKLTNVNIVGSNGAGLGALADYATGKAVIERVAVIGGRVINNGGFVGGLVGQNEGRILQCCARLDEVNGGSDHAGGLVGAHSDNSIVDSYAANGRTETRGSGDEDNGKSGGGLIGSVGYDATIQRCYANGLVVAPHTTRKGGLAGHQANHLCAKDSYYNVDATTIAGGPGHYVDSAGLKQDFANWDFANVWDNLGGAAYPQLRWMGTATDNAPPFFMGGYLKVANATGSSFDLCVKVDEAATLYYVMQTAGGPTPSRDQIVAGTNAAGQPALKDGKLAVTSKEERVIPIAGLQAETDYSIYLVAKDQAGYWTAVAEVTGSTLSLAPTLMAVAIRSSNPINTLAKPGEQITLSFTAAQPLQDLPQVTIAGNTATVTKGSGNTYEATYAMKAADSQGEIGFRIEFRAQEGTPGLPVTATSNGSRVIFDNTPPVAATFSADVTGPTNEAVAVTINFPGDAVVREYKIDPLDWLAYSQPLVLGENGRVFARSRDQAGNESDVASYVVSNIDRAEPVLTAVSIASGNPNSGWAKVGDKITLSFKASEPLANSSAVKIAGHPISVTSQGGNRYEATYTMATADVEGEIAFLITYSDLAGNGGSTVAATTDGSEVIFDKTPPAGPGMSVDITAPTNSDVHVTIAYPGDAATKQYKVGGSWVICTGPVAISENGTIYARCFDPAGNESDTRSYVVNNIDKTAPVLTALTIKSNNANKGWAKAGDGITLNFTASETLEGLPTVFIAGKAASVIGLEGNSYQASYTMADVDAEGQIAFTINFTDAVGNKGIPVRGTSDESKVIFDRIPPADASFLANAEPTNGKVEVTINFPEDAAVKEYRVNNDEAWRAYSGPVTMNDNGEISARSHDLAGNASNVVTYTVNNIDRIPPRLAAVSIASSNPTSGWAKVGDTITLSFIASEELAGSLQAWIADKAASVSSLGDNRYQATYTMADADAEGVIALHITYSDLAGNAGPAATGTTDGSTIIFDKTPPEAAAFSANIRQPTNSDLELTITYSADAVVREYKIDDGEWETYSAPIMMVANGTVYARSADEAGNVSEESRSDINNIDKTPPTLAGVTIASSNAAGGWAKTGDEISLSFTASETLEGLPTVFIAGKAASVIGLEGNSYQASYTMAAADAEGPISFTINFCDVVGNEGVPVTTTSDESKVIFDRTPPADAVITIIAMRSPLQVSIAYPQDAHVKEYKLGGGEWQAYHSPITLRAGDTVYARSTDAAGNMSSEIRRKIRSIDENNEYSPGSGGTPENTQTPLIIVREKEQKAYETQVAPRMIEIIENAKAEGIDTLVVDISAALPGEAQVDLLNVQIPAGVVQEAAGLDILVVTPYGTLELPAQLVKELAAASRGFGFTATVGRKEAVRAQVGQCDELLGEPVDISMEAAAGNMQLALHCHVSLPKGEMERASFLQSLYVLALHGADDNEQIDELALNIDEAGFLTSVTFEVERFGTFALIRAGGQLVEQPERKLVTSIGGRNYTLNGESIAFDNLTAYRAKDGATVMAVRLLQELGAQIGYTRTAGVGVVTVTYGGTRATLREDSQVMLVEHEGHKKEVTLRAKFTNTQGRTYLPTRDVAENLGFFVHWSAANDNITVTAK